MQVEVITSQNVTGFHCWPTPTDKRVLFLGQNHRHIFRVRAGWRVQELDRQLEIFLLEQTVQTFLDYTFPPAQVLPGLEFGANSCEHLARLVLDNFQDQGMIWCEFLEDNMGGAKVSLD